MQAIQLIGGLILWVRSSLIDNNYGLEAVLGSAHFGLRIACEAAAHPRGRVLSGGSQVQGFRFLGDSEFSG